jgi:TolB protein
MNPFAAVAAAAGLALAFAGNIYVDGQKFARGTQPAWSADGKRLAFIRDGEVVVADADGRNVRRLTQRRPGLHWPASSPAWSRDGRVVAFSGTRDIYTVRVADGKLTRLTRSEESWRGNFTPSYSPDGKRIAFARSVNAFNADIFVMNANGTGLRRVTTSPASDGRFGEEHGPTWSPDGRTLVYVSNRDGQWELYAIGADGRGERRLTNTPNEDEDAPRFTRGGAILYSHDGKIAEMTAGGQKLRELGRGTSADLR